jgi:hypothetical protein
MTRLHDSETALPVAPTNQRHYAQLMTLDTQTHKPVVTLGLAEYTDTGWYFQATGAPEGHYVDLVNLTLLGHADISDAQRVADGNYIDAAMRRHDYGNGTGK